jgi:hypothetical protein
MTSRLRQNIVWVLPLLCALLLYANSVNLPFFSDDIPTQRYLTSASFADIWQRVDMNGTYYRPFANLFYKYVPLNAPLWHSLMLWVHLLNVALTAVLARQMGLSGRGQVLASTIYAVFPFTAQAVLWVGAGFHLLLTLLVLGASVASVRWLRQPAQKVALVGAWLCGFFAPFAHESGVLTPLLVSIVLACAINISALLRQWRRLLMLMIPIAIGSVAYWVLRANALQGSGFSIESERIFGNLAFFAQGLSLPAQFVFGIWTRLRPDDGVSIAYLATLVWLGLGMWLLRRNRWQIWQVLCASVFCLVALAPAYLLLHPDYVRYGERLMGVAVPMMVLAIALILQALPRRIFAVTSVALIGACLLFSQEYVFLHQLHATAYNALFADLQTRPDTDQALLFVNLPSQIESQTPSLPLTRANGGLLTDWLELRDFLWLNVTLREFPQVTYAYVPEYYELIDGYRQRVYGNLTTPQALPALFAQHHTVWRTHLVDNALHIDEIGTQNITISDAPYLFGESIALHDVSWQRTRDGRLAITLQWQKVRSGVIDNTPFVHILCGDSMLTQADGDPLDNLYPFGMWREGETWADVRYIRDISVDETCLRVRVGLYNRVTQARATITQNGAVLEDEWVIFEQD